MGVFGRVLAVFQRLVAQRLARLSAAFAGKTAAVLDVFWTYSTKSPLLSVESGGLFGKRCGVLGGSPFAYLPNLGNVIVDLVDFFLFGI